MKNETIGCGCTRQNRHLYSFLLSPILILGLLYHTQMNIKSRAKTQKKTHACNLKKKRKAYLHPRAVPLLPNTPPLPCSPLTDGRQENEAWHGQGNYFPNYDLPLNCVIFSWIVNQSNKGDYEEVMQIGTGQLREGISPRSREGERATIECVRVLAHMRTDRFTYTLWQTNTQWLCMQNGS